MHDINVSVDDLSFLFFVRFGGPLALGCVCISTGSGELLAETLGSKRACLHCHQSVEKDVFGIAACGCVRGNTSLLDQQDVACWMALCCPTMSRQPGQVRSRSAWLEAQ